MMTWKPPTDTVRGHVLAELDRWVEGVTPTWAECEHGVIVARGTYLRPMSGTGFHYGCWTNILSEQEQAYYDALAEEAWPR